MAHATCFFGAPRIALCLVLAQPVLALAQQAGSQPVPLPQRPLAPTVLGADQARFYVNGKPAFLFGVSYFGGLGASAETLRSDFDWLRGHRVNLIRVWATWDRYGEDLSVVDLQGRPRPKYLSRLHRLIDEADARGLIVDVTIARGSRATGGPFLADEAAHLRAIQAIATVLQMHRNWYLDLANERSVEDDRFVPFAQLARLRAEARRLRPNLLVTASHGGEIRDEELREYIETAQLDILCPHRERSDASPERTAEDARRLMRAMARLRRVVPVLYQEPFRLGYGEWEPTPEDFVIDLRGAVEGGAGGWFYHNGDTRSTPDRAPRRSFDLRTQPLRTQLTPREHDLLRRLSEQLPGAR